MSDRGLIDSARKGSAEAMMRFSDDVPCSHEHTRMNLTIPLVADEYSHYGVADDGREEKG